MSNFKYKRVLLKLSGEALADKSGHGLDFDLVSDIASKVKTLLDGGVKVAVVVGGGNIIRGMAASKNSSMNRANADYMGMLATIINAMGLAEGFNANGVKTRVLSSIPIERVCDSYTVRFANECLDKGEVVICAGGTGVPFFTTDTNASLRACELQCDCIMKATKVDGVYDSDPVENPDAKKFEEITFDEVLSRELRVLDLTATSMCMDNNIPIAVFNMDDTENIVRVIAGENVGTIVTN